MPRREPEFEIDATYSGDAYVVRIKGELDMAGSPTLEFAMGEAERSGADRIHLDLEELTFIDARGLNAIVQASRRAASNGNRLQITPGKGQVAKVFHLTELDTELPFSNASPDPSDAGASRTVTARTSTHASGLHSPQTAARAV